MSERDIFTRLLQKYTGTYLLQKNKLTQLRPHDETKLTADLQNAVRNELNFNLEWLNLTKYSQAG